MQCLHCGRRLSLLRRLSDRGFCSSEHQQRYLQEQETIGLARLLETNRRNECEARRRDGRRCEELGGIPLRGDKFFLEVPRALFAQKDVLKISSRSRRNWQWRFPRTVSSSRCCVGAPPVVASVPVVRADEDPIPGMRCPVAQKPVLIPPKSPRPLSARLKFPTPLAGQATLTFASRCRDLAFDHRRPRVPFDGMSLTRTGVHQTCPARSYSAGPVWVPPQSLGRGAD
jgi:hypothetical protein